MHDDDDDDDDDLHANGPDKVERRTNFIVLSACCQYPKKEGKQTTPRWLARAVTARPSRNISSPASMQDITFHSI